MEKMSSSREESITKHGLILHAVAVSAPEGAILILGHSGAGKSTLGRALAEKFPLLADDNVYLTTGILHKRWFVADAKLLHLQQPQFRPLLGAIRTFQAPQVRLTPIGPRQTCRFLLDALYEVEGMRLGSLEQQKHWFGCLAEVARQVPGWRLSATLGRETAQLVFDCFAQNTIVDEQIFADPEKVSNDTSVGLAGQTIQKGV
jgi:energy-coupling factor transporter ATP-binding protein EcfA2